MKSTQSGKLMKNAFTIHQLDFVPPPPPNVLLLPLFGGGKKGGAMPSDDDGHNDGLPIGFSDPKIRQGFVCRVFGIIALMLGMVILIATATQFHVYQCCHNGAIFRRPIVTDALDPIISKLSNVAFAYVYIFLFCFHGFRRSHPAISICMLTLSTAFMIATIASKIAVFFVIQQFAMLALLCAGCLLFSLATKRDLCSPLGFMFIFALNFILVPSFNFVPSFRRIVDVFNFRIFDAFNFQIFAAMYLASAIQMFMDARVYNIAPGEYAFAAITLFSAFPKMFWLTLRMSTAWKLEWKSGGGGGGGGI